MAGRSSDDPSALTRVEQKAGAQVLHLQRCAVRVIKGRDKGKQALLATERIRIGRGEPNDLALDDDLASRLHAEISVLADGFRILDLGSRNGTFIDRHRVVDAFLSPGDRIRIGDSVLVFEAADGTVALPLAPGTRFGRLQAESVAMRRVLEVLGRAAATDVTLLIHGETGTGKEESARALHAASARAAGPFVVLDCGSVPATLLASELFGHEKGAFTGAVGLRKGAFERAHGGTLFLDELGELALDLQPQLLRVLERREVQRLGGEIVIPVDVRLVAATNRDLRRDVNAGRFRSDLYFRLAVVELTLPPLRERLADLPILIASILSDLEAKGSVKVPPLSSFDLETLAKHYWPGNVRELRNVIERSVLLGAGLDLPDVAGAVDTQAADEVSLLPYREAKAALVDRFERRYVEALLKRSEGNISKAAREAKMDRSYLLELIKKHGLQNGA
ncbi:MAG: sigma 54-dependent Fis family transcriptional regulator [Deltaproteobacteria bacterium]|nr:sigma 54-dependent Fis family transcriptional regulator [Deltaproteobacteria bacterium]